MQEEYGRFHLEPDDGYTSPVPLDRTAVARSNVNLSRTRNGVVRRGPRRSIIANVPLFGVHSATWDTDLCDDLPTIRTLLEALCDRGSATSITDGHQWTMGDRDAGFRTFSAWAATDDGLSHRLRGGICREVSLSLNTGTIAALATAWEFLSIEETAEEDPDTEANATAYAGALECSATWGGEALTAWAVALNFSRDLMVGDIDDTGQPRGYAGRPTVDIAGKLSGRISADDAAELFASDMTRELVLTMTAGAVTLTISLHRVQFMMTGRRIVGTGQIEHAVEFVATASDGLPTATVSLVQS